MPNHAISNFSNNPFMDDKVLNKNFNKIPPVSNPTIPEWKPNDDRNQYNNLFNGLLPNFGNNDGFGTTGYIPPLTQAGVDPSVAQNNSQIFDLQEQKVNESIVNNSSNIFTPRQTPPETGLGEDIVKTNSFIFGQPPPQNPPGEEKKVNDFGGENPDNPNGFPDGNNENGQLGLTRQDNITDLGNIYEDNVTKTLQGKNADVTSARNRMGRDNKFQSYYDDKQVRESLAQAGLQPGTIEYQRAMDRARSNTNIANLGREQGVNQMQRNYYNDAMSMARGVENEQYNRAFGAEDKIYGREVDAYFDAKSDKLLDRKGLESWIGKQPLKVQNILTPLLLEGGDVKGALEEMYKNGTLEEDYRPADENQTLMDSSTSYYEQLYPKNGMNDDQWSNQRLEDTNNDGVIDDKDNTIGELIKNRFKNVDEAIQDPIRDAKGDRDDKVFSENTFNDAFKDGDYSKMTEKMWTGLDDKKRSDLKASAKNMVNDTGWNSGSDPDNYSDSKAKNLYYNSLGVEMGEPINFGGTTYITTKITVEKAGGDNKRVAIWGTNTQTGKEEKIQSSDKFENSMFGADKEVSTPTDESGNPLY